MGFCWVKQLILRTFTQYNLLAIFNFSRRFGNFPVNSPTQTSHFSWFGISVCITVWWQKCWTNYRKTFNFWSIYNVELFPALELQISAGSGDHPEHADADRSFEGKLDELVNSSSRPLKMLMFLQSQETSRTLQLDMHQKLNTVFTYNLIDRTQQIRHGTIRHLLFLVVASTRTDFMFNVRCWRMHWLSG